MIEKFSAASLGCLRDLESPQLEKHALIFGENGTGKSTIAAAIRAARDADADAMLERASLAGGSPEFQMTFDGEALEFDGKKWNGKMNPNIAVFDQAFVNQNIHSGDQLENEHKKKLYSIVLGDTCAAKLKEQSELAEEITDHNRRVKDIQRDIESKIPGNLEFGEFVKLEPVKNVDSEIEKQAAVVDLFKKQQALNDAVGFEEIELPKASSSLAQTLSKTIDSISDDAETKVKTHLKEHTGGASTRWIEDGLKHQKDDTCPFCGTSTDANDLLESYKDFFSDSYADLKAEINSLSGLADSYFGESTMLKFQRRFDSNKNAGEFWKAYIEVPPLDHSVFEELTDELGECRDRTKKSIEQKQQNPLDEVSLGDISISSSLQERIDDYNTLVGVANKRIETVRESQKQADSDGQLQKLNQLQAAKLRHSGAVKEMVAEWESADAVKAKNSNRRKALQESIEEETAAVFDRQGAAINSVLKTMQAKFRLAALETNNRTKPPSVQLHVEISDTEIQLGDKVTKSQRPFRSTLSSAERTMLAFAFFVATQRSSESFPESVIVIDDPITSFDQVRLEKTAEVISGSLSEAKQLLIFSHNSDFLKSLASELSKPQQLQLTSDPKSGSELSKA